MTIDSRNKVFTASLLFRSLRDGVFLSENLWEESFVLIYANSDRDAEEQARQIGQSRKLSYETADGVELTWEFFKVERVFEVVDAIGHGAEVFSRHLRTGEVDSLLTSFD